MPEDARPVRRTGILVIRASVEADGQFLARITVISDWMAGSPRHVLFPAQRKLSVPSKPGYERWLSQAKPSRHPEVAWSHRRDRLPIPFFRVLSRQMGC